MPHTTRKTPFVIWFEGRSGSSHLVSLLNDHPNILCRGENFDALLSDPQDGTRECNTVEFEGEFYHRRLANFESTIWGPTREQVLSHLAELLDWKRSANGFKFKHSRQSYLFPEVYEALLQQGATIRIIHLLRKNIVKRAISKQNQVRIRKLQGRANLQVPSTLSKLHVDVPALLKYCERLNARSERFMAFPANFSNVMTVEYDDLLKQPGNVLTSLFRFLNVPSVGVKTRLFKATPDSIVDAVDNFDELYLALKNTEYESFLES